MGNEKEKKFKITKLYHQVIDQDYSKFIYIYIYIYINNLKLSTLVNNFTYLVVV
jgi:hypothetical protein